MTATCDCKFNDIANNNLIKDNAFLDGAVGEIFDLINSSNILVFKCINNIFSKFSSSIGGWISLILISSHIGMTLTFIFLSAEKVSKYLFSLTSNYLAYISKQSPNLPPKRNIGKTDKKGKRNNYIESKFKPQKSTNKDLVFRFQEESLFKSSKTLTIFKLLFLIKILIKYILMIYYINILCQYKF